MYLLFFRALIFLTSRSITSWEYQGERLEGSPPGDDCHLVCGPWLLTTLLHSYLLQTLGFPGLEFLHPVYQKWFLDVSLVFCCTFCAVIGRDQILHSNRKLAPPIKAMQYKQEFFGLFIKHEVPLKPTSSAAAKPDMSLALEAFGPGET